MYMKRSLIQSALQCPWQQVAVSVSAMHIACRIWEQMWANICQDETIGKVIFHGRSVFDINVISHLVLAFILTRPHSLNNHEALFYCLPFIPIFHYGTILKLQPAIKMLFLNNFEGLFVQNGCNLAQKHDYLHATRYSLE